jgi:hypothetical protein
VRVRACIGLAVGRCVLGGSDIALESRDALHRDRAGVAKQGVVGDFLFAMIQTLQKFYEVLGANVLRLACGALEVIRRRSRSQGSR